MRTVKGVMHLASASEPGYESDDPLPSRDTSLPPTRACIHEGELLRET